MTLDEAIKHAEEVAEQNFNNAVYIMDKAKSDIAISNAEECKRRAQEHRQLAEWLKELKQLREQTRWIPVEVLDKISAEIKEWYWQADKQALAKDPCVVDAMIDLFIRTIDKYTGESEGKE